MKKLERPRLLKALAKAQAFLAPSPDFWPALEGVGRCLYYLGDHAAAAYLAQAADRMPAPGQRFIAVFHQANLYRLAGMQAQAAHGFQQVIDHITKIGGFLRDTNELLFSLTSFFYHQRYAEVVALYQRAQREKPERVTWILPILADVADKQQRGQSLDPAVLAPLEDHLRKMRGAPWDTEHYNLWDIYDVLVRL